MQKLVIIGAGDLAEVRAQIAAAIADPGMSSCVAIIGDVETDIIEPSIPDRPKIDLYALEPMIPKPDNSYPNNRRGRRQRERDQRKNHRNR